MKKLVLVLALVAIIGTGSAFAQFAVGIHTSGGMVDGQIGGGLGVNLTFSNIFIYIDGAGLGTDSIHITGAVDFAQFLGGDLGSGFGWYLRLGVPISLWGFNRDFSLAAGVRAPIGLNWRPNTFLEVFLQAVPQIGLQILPIEDIGLWADFFGGTLGIRFWL